MPGRKEEIGNPPARFQPGYNFTTERMNSVRLAIERAGLRAGSDTSDLAGDAAFRRKWAMWDEYRTESDRSRRVVSDLEKQLRDIESKPAPKSKAAATRQKRTAEEIKEKLDAWLAYASRVDEQTQQNKVGLDNIREKVRAESGKKSKSDKAKKPPPGEAATKEQRKYLERLIEGADITGRDWQMVSQWWDFTDGMDKPKLNMLTRNQASQMIDGLKNFQPYSRGMSLSDDAKARWKEVRARRNAEDEKSGKKSSKSAKTVTFKDGKGMAKPKKAAEAAPVSSGGSSAGRTRKGRAKSTSTAKGGRRKVNIKMA